MSNGELAWAQTYTSVLTTLGSIFASAGFSVYMFFLSGGEQLIVEIAGEKTPLFITGGLGMIGIGACFIAIGLVIARKKITKLCT